MQWNYTPLGHNVRGGITLRGSFRIDGTSDPDVIRDADTNMITSVTRNSAGKFTVVIGGLHPIPEKLVSWNVDIMQGLAPTAWIKPHLVIDSYSQVTRSFVIQCWDSQTPSATDPDDNDMICFELTGSIHSTGTDAA